MKIEELDYKPVQNVDVKTIIVEERDEWPMIERMVHRADLQFDYEGRTCVLMILPGEEFARGYIVEHINEQDFALMMVQAIAVLQQRRLEQLPIKD